MNDWEQILAFLKQKKIKKVDFAKQMEVSRQTLDNWINGKTNPTTAELTRMSKIIGDLLKDVSQFNPGNNFDVLLRELKEAHRKNSELKDDLLKLKDEKISRLEEELAKYKAKERGNN